MMKNLKINRKSLLLLLLIIVAITLWSKILISRGDDRDGDVLSSPQKVRENIKKEEEIKAGQIRKQGGNSSIIGKNKDRESPFISQDGQDLEFGYQNSVVSNSYKKQLKSIFNLLGITKKGENEIALLDLKGRIYFLQIGDEINDFKVKRIGQREIILLKDNMEYKLEIPRHNI